MKKLKIPSHLERLILIFLLSAFLFLIESRYIPWHFNPISSNTLHYFFSALSQSMAALFALFGMFAIYKLQIEGNRKRDLISNIKSRVSHWGLHVPKDIMIWTDSEFVRELGKAVKEMEEEQKRQQESDLVTKISIFKADIKKISSIENVIVSVKSRFGLPIRLVFYTFALSIIALPFAELLSGLFFGLLFMFFIIVLTLRATLEILNYIFFVFVV